MSTAPTERVGLWASVAVLLAGALWGISWLPLRALEKAGLEGAWVSVGFFAVALLVLLPWAGIRWRELLGGGAPLFVTGLFTGCAFTLYSTSLLLTDVVRALLLFYVTPVWSTLLGYFLLGELISRARVVALVMGIAGLGVILGYSGGLPLPANLGDWMGLLAGISWAYGSVRVHGEGGTQVFEPTFAFFGGGLVTALLVVSLPLDGVGHMPSPSVLWATLPWIFLFTALVIIPSMMVLFWAARRLSPGRVGLLLMSEIVIGIISAALLTDEPFGWREMSGTILITGAALIEVLQASTRAR